METRRARPCFRFPDDACGMLGCAGRSWRATSARTPARSPMRGRTIRRVRLRGDAPRIPSTRVKCHFDPVSPSPRVPYPVRKGKAPCPKGLVTFSEKVRHLFQRGGWGHGFRRVWLFLTTSGGLRHGNGCAKLSHADLGVGPGAVGAADFNMVGPG